MNKLEENIKLDVKEGENVDVTAIYLVRKTTSASNKDPSLVDLPKMQDDMKREVRAEVLSASAEYFTDFECPKNRVGGFALVCNVFMPSSNVLIGSDTAINNITILLEKYQSLVAENNRLNALMSVARKNL